MLEKKKIFGDNLSEFIHVNYGTQENFRLRHGFSKSRLSNWTNGIAYPPVEVINDLFSKDGCNIHWLMTSNGEMWAENPIGIKLKKEYYKKHPELLKDEEPLSSKKIRLAIEWIKSNYGDLFKFCTKFELDYEKWLALMNLDIINAPDNYHDILEKAGLNYEYINSLGNAYPYIDNENGRYLSLKYRNSLPPSGNTNRISSCELINKPEILDNALHKAIRQEADRYMYLNDPNNLKEIVSGAVREEIKKYLSESTSDKKNDNIK